MFKYRVPHAPALGGLQIMAPLMVGIRSPDGLVVGLAAATLEFCVRFPNERNQGKQGTTLRQSVKVPGSRVTGPNQIEILALEQVLQ